MSPLRLLWWSSMKAQARRPSASAAASALSRHGHAERARTYAAKREAVLNDLRAYVDAKKAMEAGR